jgi:hypothetical protein
VLFLQAKNAKSFFHKETLAEIRSILIKKVRISSLANNFQLNTPFDS